MKKLFIQARTGSSNDSSIAAHAIVLAVCIVFHLAICTLMMQSQALADTSKNVLLITVDTLRADHLGCYGYKRNTSPQLDALAKRSVIFSRAFTQGGWTKPAMASVMLSLYPFNHGVFSGSTKLPPEIPTLAQVLDKSGYTSIAIQTNPFLQKGQGFAAGFDSYHFEADATADRVVNLFIEHIPPQAPWFAYLHFMDPHLPYKSPSGKFVDSAYTGLLSSSETLNHRFIRRQIPNLSPQDKQFLIDRYDEEIAFFDTHFGRMVDWLKSRALLDQTIIIIISDHGEEFFEHGGFEHGHSLYNEILHVPFIYYDSRLKPAVRSEVVRTLDVYPTLLDQLGIIAPPHVLGANLGPALKGFAPLPELQAFSAGMRIGARREALQDQNFKIINTEAGSPRFYDLKKDPGETNNLAKHPTPPQEHKQYKLLLQQFKKQGPKMSAPRADPDKNENETVKALESLGYL